MCGYTDVDDDKRLTEEILKMVLKLSCHITVTFYNRVKVKMEEIRYGSCSTRSRRRSRTVYYVYIYIHRRTYSHDEHTQRHDGFIDMCITKKKEKEKISTINFIEWKKKEKYFKWFVPVVLIAVVVYSISMYIYTYKLYTRRDIYLTRPMGALQVHQSSQKLYRDTSIFVGSLKISSGIICPFALTSLHCTWT